MEPWIWLVIIGVIFALSIGILVWIIVVSNKLVILKNAVDRNFPVINSKIKQYCEKTNQLVNYIDKKEGKHSKKSKTLKAEVKACLETDGMVNRAIAQKEIAAQVLEYIKEKSTIPALKKSKNILTFARELDELQEQLNNAIEKYNVCVGRYNKLRESFPSNIISERFKFGARNQWNV